MEERKGGSHPDEFLPGVQHAKTFPFVIYSLRKAVRSAIPICQLGPHSPGSTGQKKLNPEPMQF